MKLHFAEHVCVYIDSILTAMAVCDKLLHSEGKKLVFLRAPVMSPRTVPAFGRGYSATSSEINAQKNRKMHGRVIEQFLRLNISSVRKIPVCESGNTLLQDPVSSHCPYPPVLIYATHTFLFALVLHCNENEILGIC